MTPKVQDLLLEVALYRQLSDEDREHLALAATVEQFAKGEAVFREGDPARDFFTLARGRVKVYKVMDEHGAPLQSTLDFEGNTSTRKI